MELYQLKTFVTVAELGHLTRAAEKLHISQPSVSAHIKALEGELGLTLFLRTPKGMNLTAEGRVLKEKAEKALESISDLKSRARALKEELTGVVRIGINTDPLMLKVGELFSAMRENCPGLEFHLLQNQSWGVLDDVREEKIDAGFIYGKNPHADVAALPLRMFNMVVIAPPGWKERLRDADWREVAKLPWIGVPPTCPFNRVTLDLFEKEEINPLKVAVADQETTLCNLVSTGVGLTLMIEEEARALEAKGRVTVWGNAPKGLELSYVSLKMRSEEPALAAVEEGIRRVWNLE